MKLFLLTFITIGLAIIGMAVGVIFSHRRIKGSCGGLGAVMGEECMFCSKEKCDEKKKRG